jgi:hypothetical protein
MDGVTTPGRGGGKRQRLIGRRIWRPEKSQIVGFIVGKDSLPTCNILPFGSVLAFRYNSDRIQQHCIGRGPVKIWESFLQKRPVDSS